MDNNKKSKGLDIEDALKYTEGIINIIQDSLIILYEDFTVALANLSFYQTFKVKSGKTEGKLIYDLRNRQWDIPKLR